jgi:hypothetical protein
MRSALALVLVGLALGGASVAVDSIYSLADAQQGDYIINASVDFQNPDRLIVVTSPFAKGRLEPGSSSTTTLEVSTDGGKTFSVLAGSEDLDFLSVTHSSSNSDILVASQYRTGQYTSSTDGIYYSANNGTAWIQAYGPKAVLRVFTGENGNIYGLTRVGAGVKSTDEGQSFSEIFPGASAAYGATKLPIDLLISATEEKVFVTAADRGLYGSSDGGASWQHLLPEETGGGDYVALADFADGLVHLASSGSGRPVYTLSTSGSLRTSASLELRSGDAEGAVRFMMDGDTPMVLTDRGNIYRYNNGSWDGIPVIDNIDLNLIPESSGILKSGADPATYYAYGSGTGVINTVLLKSVGGTIWGAPSAFLAAAPNESITLTVPPIGMAVLDLSSETLPVNLRRFSIDGLQPGLRVEVAVYTDLDSLAQDITSDPNFSVVDQGDAVVIVLTASVAEGRPIFEISNLPDGYGLLVYDSSRSRWESVDATYDPTLGLLMPTEELAEFSYLAISRGIPDPPEPMEDFVVSPGGGGITIEVLKNDTNVTGIESYTQPAHGRLDFMLGTDMVPIAAYYPEEGYAGQDTFTYTPKNGDVIGPETAVYIDVTAGDPIQALEDYAAIPSGALLTIDILVNDTGATSIDSYTQPANGTLEFLPDPESGRPIAWYRHSEGFIGRDQFTYAPSNGTVVGVPVNVIIDVLHPGQPEGNLDYPVCSEGSVDIDVLTNDKNGVGIASFTSPGHGTVTQSTNADGKPILHYEANSGYTGRDSFTYVPSNGDLLGDSIRVELKVVDGQLIAKADFDGDGEVGFTDFLAFARTYGARDGDTVYDIRYDLNEDGAIDFADFLRFVPAMNQYQLLVN